MATPPCAVTIVPSPSWLHNGLVSASSAVTPPLYSPTLHILATSDSPSRQPLLTTRGGQHRGVVDMLHCIWHGPC